MKKWNLPKITAIVAISILLVFIFQTNAQETQKKSKIKEAKAEIIWGKYDELTTRNIFQKREISQYAQGGHFDCRRFDYGKESGECNEKAVRDFIWNQWAEKKRGYIRVTYNSVDSTSTEHVFIEPNKKNEWRVVLLEIGSHALGGNMISDLPEAVTVERIENKPRNGDWALTLKDKNGDIVRNFPYFDK